MKPYTLQWVDRSPPVSVEAYRRLARKALPKMAWTYVEGGADDLATIAQNRNAFSAYRLRQRSLAGVDSPVLATEMAGTEVSMPVALAPTGLSGLTRWNADVAAARAAEAMGTRFALSTGSMWSIEEVAEATEQNHWFQLYAIGHQGLVGSLIERAKAAGYTALFLTVDTSVPGNREGERQNGVGVPLRLTPGRLLDFALHPRWLIELLRHKRIAPINFDPAGLKLSAERTLGAAMEAIAVQQRYMGLDLNWDDLAWVRERWPGKFYVKGITDPDDAARAVEQIGADGVVVSNHGGRQLDSVPGTFDMLAQVAPRLKGKGEVYLDGGVRRGTDVIKALCLGAKGVFIGRPYLYGLAVHGEAGARNVLGVFRDELKRDLSLMGCPSVAALDRSWLLNPDGTPAGEG